MAIGDAARKIKLMFKMTKCRCVEVIYLDKIGIRYKAYFHRDQNVVRKLSRIHKDFKDVEILEIKEIK